MSFLAIMYPLYATLNKVMKSMIGDYNEFNKFGDNTSLPFKIRVVNMKVSFHFIMAFAWIMQYGLDKSLNFLKYKPNMPLYNLTCFSTCLFWFSLVLVNDIFPSTDAKPIEDVILFNCGYLDQSLGSGLYVLTSFYPFGAFSSVFGCLW